MTLKEKIIKVSYDLFGTQGYEETTIADIVKTSGSSKGGFYHHFKSKEDIIDTTFDSYVDDLKTYYNNLYDFYNNDTIKVFNGVFKAINIYKSDYVIRWPDFMKMLSSEGNGLVRMRMSESIGKMTEAFYSELIQKGNHEGLWSIDTPCNIAGLWTREILRLYTEMSTLLSDYNEYNYNKFVSLLDFDEQLINLLLSTDQIAIKEETLNYFKLAKPKSAQPDINSYKTLNKIV